MEQMTEEDTRSLYAQWFVREHFIVQDYERWKTQFSTHGGELYQWSGIMQDGCLRYMRFDQDRWDADYRYIKKNFTDKLVPYDRKWPCQKDYELGWHTIPLTDLDLPIHDNTIQVKDARRWRETHHGDQYWQWLIKEAEYYRVYHEAVLRSYGTDVYAGITAPPPQGG